MPVRIVNQYDANYRGGVPQYNARLQRAFARYGLNVPWEHPSRGGWDAAHDILIVTNEDAILIPPDIAVIAIQHGCAIERWDRGGHVASEAFFGAVDGAQREAAKRERTYWVACSEECAYEYFTHHGYHADRIIPGGLDTNDFFPGERQLRKETERPVVLHDGRDFCKGKDAIGAVAEALGDEFIVRGLDAPPEAVPDAMRAADIFLCLSRLEGCPCVVSEAMASGLVIVTTDTGLYWREDSPPGYRMRWQDRDDPQRVAFSVRKAWGRRHELDARRYALRWLNLPAFGQAFIEAAVEAASRFGVTP
jgi:glycosyltransferase involved in cell wall biosynthesis